MTVNTRSFFQLLSNLSVWNINEEKHSTMTYFTILLGESFADTIFEMCALFAA